MNATTRTHLRRSLRSAFTLAEMMVAVACLALLSLGVAQIFSLTTRTVSAGRKLSNLNAVASATERQLRADFSAITREGVLLIRNEQADGGAAVFLSPDDQAPRVRRIDEILFFAKGNFATARAPMAPDLVVKSQEAMIWLGHGLKQDPTVAQNQVMLDDANASAPGFNQPGPNRYAADWVLGRRVTLLAPMAATARTGLQTAYDSEWVIGQQPAAGSIFRNVAATTAPSRPTAFLFTSQSPALASGAVDIAVGDLQDVRKWFTWASFGNVNLQAPVGLSGTGGPGATSMYQQQAQMKQLLPADSDLGHRMRIETSAPNYLGLNWANGLSPDQQSMARADQAMLTSAAFLPRCTEFIVEYSFGLAEPLGGAAGTTGLVAPGATYWHGLPRSTPVGPGANPTDHDRADVYPFSQVQSARGTAPISRAVLCRDGTVRTQPLQPAELEAAGPATGTMYCFFGQTDPLYSPMVPLQFFPTTPPMKALLKDVNGNREYDRLDGDILNAPATQPWPWPTMIRITFSLADSTDPTVEQTFQFVFTVPSDKPAAGM